MIALHIAGSLQNCKTLPHDIDLELLRSLSVSSPLYRQQFQTYIAALGTSKADLAIKAALEECLSKNRASEHGLDVD